LIALLQRVNHSKVTVDGETVGEISLGYNILLGVLKEDDETDIEKLVQKIVNLRVFSDENGKMNKSILDVKGEALVVSQFTLAGNVKKGRRPSFDNAMSPVEAKRLYEEFCLQLGKHIEVQTGKFGAMMEVEIINDGPVTFIIDSKEL